MKYQWNLHGKEKTKKLNTLFMWQIRKWRTQNFISEFSSLQCSWLKWLFGKSFHPWIVILLFLVLGTFPEFYWELFFRWGKYFLSPPSTVGWQFLSFNKHIKTGNKSIYLQNLSNKNNNIKSTFLILWVHEMWECLKDQFCLNNNMQF